MLVQRTVSLLIIAILLVGCGPIPELEERVEYWTLETTDFLRGTVTIDDIHPWLRERGVIYTFDDDDIVDGSWKVALEKLYPNTFRCEWVDIVLVVGFDDIGRVQSSYIDLNQACLW